MTVENPAGYPAIPVGIESTSNVAERAAERDLALVQIKLDKAERELDKYKEFLIELANDAIELAYSLDYEIGGVGQTLSRIATETGLIELPMKRVTLEGTLVRHYDYNVVVDVPIFDDIDAINHDDYADEICEDEGTNDVTFWEINSGAAYHN
jgi:hypothetical protein